MNSIEFYLFCHCDTQDLLDVVVLFFSSISLSDVWTCCFIDFVPLSHSLCISSAMSSLLIILYILCFDSLTFSFPTFRFYFSSFSKSWFIFFYAADLFIYTADIFIHFASISFIFLTFLFESWIGFICCSAPFKVIDHF